MSALPLPLPPQSSYPTLVGLISTYIISEVWGERVRQHPQLGNRFVRACSALFSYPMSFHSTSVKTHLHLLSLPSSTCIFYLLGWYLLSVGFSIFSHEFSKKVRKEICPSEFSKIFLKSILTESASEREFSKRVLK